MDSNKSSDLCVEILAKTLADVQTLQSEALTPQALKLTVEKLRERCACEGLGFLTKALPSLGKALDRALSSEQQTLIVPQGFELLPGSKLPRFLGELFGLVFSGQGTVLATPCVVSIRNLRQICYLFYKLDVPYPASTKLEVLNRFKETEKEISQFDAKFQLIADFLDSIAGSDRPVYPAHHIKTFAISEPVEGSAVDSSSKSQCDIDSEWGWRVIRGARKLLSQLFRRFDPWDIVPTHGPGAVSTKEELHRKYMFKRINPRIDTMYPFPEYFCASAGHACDSCRSFLQCELTESNAKVVLVPKDSRGPRLISAEPLENQWVQQGLARAIVRRVESHPLTRDEVHFTDQRPNQYGALVGSRSGRYATLDLKDASDRVTIGLVNLLFPEPVLRGLMSCRSLATTLPTKEVLTLRKYAPMGSALCFPVLALSIWALLKSAATDRKDESILLVYGDDIVVNTAFAAHAMRTLESFGLKVNRDKSCLYGLFRESCGVDAFNGVNVTPVRMREPLPQGRHFAASTYARCIEFSNNLYKAGYISASHFVADWVQGLTGPIPSSEMDLKSCPSLMCIPQNAERFRRRVNKSLQRLEWYVPVVESESFERDMDGWLMLLRWFTSKGTVNPDRDDSIDLCWSRSLDPGFDSIEPGLEFLTRQYTRRRVTKVTWRWRAV